MRLFPAFSSLVHFEKRSINISRVNSLKDMRHPGPLQASVSCTRLFACGERLKVSNSSYSRDPRMRLFPVFSSLEHFEKRSINISRVNSLKVMRHSGPLQALASSTRLFAYVERTKVSNSSNLRYARICASFRPLAPSCTSKGRSNDIPEVNSRMVIH
jgi:hypothetical protein